MLIRLLKVVLIEIPIVWILAISTMLGVIYAAFGVTGCMIADAIKGDK